MKNPSKSPTSTPTLAADTWSSAWKLMRIPFSVYLMPIFWLALSQFSEPYEAWRAWAVFLILHLGVYPASNGFNSWHDRDEGPIGGLASPPKVGPKLWVLVCTFDLLSLLASLALGGAFAAMLALYVAVSKAYSWPKIRLKKYPWAGAAAVGLFQGAWTYLTVIQGLGGHPWQAFHLGMATVATLFLAGTYPLTQIYQHEEDAAHGDLTLSRLLGLRGTLLWAGGFLGAGTALLAALWASQGRWLDVGLFLVGGGPSTLYLFRWARDIWKQGSAAATHTRTMRMNQVSSLGLSAVFIVLWALSLLGLR